MSFTRIYGLFLRHFYLITRSFPRILDLKFLGMSFLSKKNVLKKDHTFY